MQMRLFQGLHRVGAQMLSGLIGQAGQRYFRRIRHKDPIR